MTSALLFVTLVVGTQWVAADLPVHCLHHQILGEWTFHLSKGEGHRFENCAHTANSFVQGDFEVNGPPRFSVSKKMHVSLKHPNIATATIDGKSQKGTWTMVYDEGFEVQLGQQKFFAFSKYKHGTKLVDDMKTSAKIPGSQCHATLPGWYHSIALDSTPKRGTWGCYYGVKKGSQDPYADAKRSHQPVRTTELEQTLDTMYQSEHKLVREINKRASSWEAATYPELEALSMREILKRAGGGNRKGVRSLKSSMPVVDKKALAAAVVTEDLPEHFDWSDVDGKNYVSEVINQGTCGSCYAVAATDMLSSRLRIKAKHPILLNGTHMSNSHDHQLSAQAILDCSQLNQGCNGGFPYLVNKWAQEYGLPTAHSVPYSGSDMRTTSLLQGGSSARSWVSRCQRRNVDTVVTKFNYIGGFYGACNEAAMRRDIKDNGPLVTAYEVNPTFQHYRRGVFEAIQEPLHSANEWEETNHAVLITGWGTDQGKKYWKVKNSWGKDWGEHGYFRIRRGNDELAIESMAVTGTPVPMCGAKICDTDKASTGETETLTQIEDAWEERSD